MRGDFRGPSAFKEARRPIGKDDRPRNHQQLRSFLQRHIKTNLPAQFDIHLVVADRATTSIQGAGSPEVRAGTFSSALSFLPRPGRPLLQAHHPSRPFGTANLKNATAYRRLQSNCTPLHVNS